MTMQSLTGPYPLDAKHIDNYVMSGMPGDFALGSIIKNRFVMKYIGRADECINFRLKEWIGKYDYFKFIYADTVKEAFEKQCRIYHKYSFESQLENDRHPQPPKGEDLKCPFCNQ